MYPIIHLVSFFSTFISRQLVTKVFHYIILHRLCLPSRPNNFGVPISLPIESLSTTIAIRLKLSFHSDIAAGTDIITCLSKCRRKNHQFSDKHRQTIFELMACIRCCPEMTNFLHRLHLLLRMITHFCSPPSSISCLDSFAGSRYISAERL